MGLVSRIKGTPFHGDKILTTMLRRAPLAFMYRVNFHASGLFPFERVHERNSNAHTFCLIMHQVSFPFERVSKRPTNASILFHFRSNAFTNATRTRAFCSISVRTRLRTLLEREHSVSFPFERVYERYTNVHTLNWVCLIMFMPNSFLVDLSYANMLMYYNSYVYVMIAFEYCSLRYIGWKPKRKFRSRFRMDGSAVCTWATIPRTAWEDAHVCACMVNMCAWVFLDVICK